MLVVGHFSTTRSGGDGDEPIVAMHDLCTNATSRIGQRLGVFAVTWR